MCVYKIKYSYIFHSPFWGETHVIYKWVHTEDKMSAKKKKTLTYLYKIISTGKNILTWLKMYSGSGNKVWKIHEKENEIKTIFDKVA